MSEDNYTFGPRVNCRICEVHYPNYIGINQAGGCAAYFIKNSEGVSHVIGGYGSKFDTRLYVFTTEPDLLGTSKDVICDDCIIRAIDLGSLVFVQDNCPFGPPWASNPFEELMK